MIRKKSRQARFVFATAALTVMVLGTAINLHAQNCDPPPAGLISWWPGETNAMDITGTNNGVVQGGLTFVSGEVGQAFSLNGTSQYVRIADSPSLNPAGSFSLEAWIYTVETGVGQTVIGKWGGQGDYFNQRCYTLYITPANALQFAISDYPHQFDTAFHQFNTVTNAITPNSWMHVAAVYDQSTGTRLIYTNGVLAAQRTDPPITVLNTNTAVGIGARLDSSTQPTDFFGGGIDEVSLYNRALSGAEVAAIYNAGSAGKCKGLVSCTAPPNGLVSWWPGETNAVDIAGANNGVVQGGLTFVGGEVGRAFSFDGTDADVLVPASASLNVGAGGGLTVDAWIKPADLIERPIVEWDSGSDFLTHFRYSSPSIAGGTGPGCLYADLKDTGGVNHTIASGAGLISSNIFQHVAVTYDKSSGAATLYLNGAVVAQQVLGTFTPDTTGNLFLGLRAAGSGAGQRYQGLMDEVDVFSRALSATEVQAIYSAGNAGKCKGSGACDARPSGLTSWWQGESDAGDAVSTNNGVLQGNLTFTSGKVGQAFSFDGTNADVMIPSSTSLNVGTGSGVTVEAWIKPNEIATEQALVEWNNGSGSVSGLGIHFWLSQAGPYGSGPGCLYANIFDTSGGGHAFTTPAGIVVANAFQHVALTYDKASGLAAIYLNGTLVTNLNFGNFTPQTTYDLYLGKRIAFTPPGPYGGLMDEVSLYNRALSASELQAIYNASGAGKCGLPPSITSQPQNQTKITGNNATFSVIVNGSHPLTYQWMFNTTNILTGATNASLTLTNAQPSQAGNYSVVVSNSINSVTSSNALLKVNALICAPPPAGTVSWWPGESNAVDVIGTNNGALQGVTFAAGEVGEAFSFNGTDADVMIPASTSLNVGTGDGVTVEAWIKPNEITSQQALVEWNNGSGSVSGLGIHFWLSQAGPYGNGPGCLYANIFDTSGGGHAFTTPAGIIVANSFQHVALTYDKTSGVAAIYLNGAMVTNLNFGSFTPQTSYDLYLGKRIAFTPPGPYGGLMDEVGLYNRALSASEILGIYDAGAAGKCKGPVSPSITTQPQSQSRVAGTNVSFSVIAAGSPVLGYQWYFDRTNLISGATNSTLSLTNVQPVNAGTYDVVVTNLYNSATSSNATLTVITFPPSITNQPQSQTVFVGNDATFTVTAGGTLPLGYQWYFNVTNLINGATNSSLTVFNVQTNNSGSYSVVVSNVAASTPSANAMLTVDLPVCDASPSGLVSWWRAESDAVDGSGTNSGILQEGTMFAPGKVGQAFSFDGTNSDVMIPTSTSLNVGAGSGFTVEAWIKPNEITNQQTLVEWNNGSGSVSGLGIHFWLSQAVPYGNGPGCLYANIFDTSGGAHAFTTAAGIVVANSFQHVALTYDKASGVAAIYLNGVTVTNLNFGSFTPQTTYDLYLGKRIAFTPPGPYDGLMDEVSLYNRALSVSEILAIYNASTQGKCVAPPTTAPSILTQPQSQTVTPGANITLTVLASGSTPLHYQWRYFGTNLPGATTAALYLTNVQPSQAGNYSVVVTNSLNSNNPLVSSNATLKVNVVLVMGNGQPLTNSQYTFIGPTTIQLQNAYPTGLVYYTLNGSTPSFNSSQYSSPFVVSNNVIVRALGYSPDFTQSGQTDPIALTIVPAYSLTLTTAGGGAVSANPPVGPYTNGAVVTLTAHPASGWTFFQWLGDASGTNTTNAVTIDRNEAVHAVFGTTLSTTVAPTGSGSVMLNPPGGLYPYGTTVLISALPQAGNYFVVWDNAPGASGNNNPLSYTVTNPNPTVSSLFATLNSGQVSLAVVPVGRGKVGVNPSGNTFSLNQSVTVTATPDAGQSFVGWSGNASGAQNPLSVSMTQSKTIYANFSKSGALSFQPLGLRSLSEGFELTLNGEYGTAYRIDGSTNLTTWVPLITLTNSFGTLQFIDYSTSNNFSDRYYRAVPLP